MHECVDGGSRVRRVTALARRTALVLRLGRASGDRARSRRRPRGRGRASRRSRCASTSSRTGGCWWWTRRSGGCSAASPTGRWSPMLTWPASRRSRGTTSWSTSAATPTSTTSASTSPAASSRRASSSSSRRTAAVAPGRRRRRVPNGMAITADGGTLIVAESYASRLTAYDIGADGDLGNRRVWARRRDDHPDGICIDAEGAVWYADVGNRHCVRVREGGEVLAHGRPGPWCFRLRAQPRRQARSCSSSASSSAARRRRNQRGRSSCSRPPRRRRQAVVDRRAASHRAEGSACDTRIDLRRVRSPKASTRRRWFG